MSTPQELSAFVSRHFGGGATVEPLAGDASDRRYYRVRTEDHTRILMQLSERFDFPYVPFSRMASFLSGIGLPVPAVREEHPEVRVLVVDDLGDCSLQQYLSGPQVDPADRQALYEEAVDWILRLQHKGTAALTPEIPAYHGCLDDVKFGRELQYFRRHYVSGLLSDPLSESQQEVLDRGLASLAAESGRPGDRTLCHRDYHARNLMVVPGAQAGARLAILDFQDARLGPRTYDLASLLCDPYVELPEELQETLSARFRAGVSGPDDTATFSREYASVAAQRMLKAVGTFAGQACRFGNRDYLPYVPPALEQARRSLELLDPMRELAGLLAGPLRFRP